jgi:dCTP deaminase
VLLSDRRIRQAMAAGDIVIEPFEAGNLGTNSYDVRLGEFYFEPNRNMQTVSFLSEEQTRKFWGEPIRATSIIPVRPGDTILAHTIEIVGGRNGYTTSMRARSSIGRSCMSVCKCAGVGDVGYIARWTMEITNHSHATIELPVGLRVAQILFFEVGDTDKQYAGKYGQSNEWSPYDMLPRLYNDPDMRLSRPTQGE